MTEANSSGMIARILHGSHLYGLAHQHSDTDYYQIVHDSFDGAMIAHSGAEVEAKREAYHSSARFGFARQTIDADGEDSMTVSLRAFQKMIEAGAPQAVEALMALRTGHENAEVLDRRYRAYLMSLRPNAHTISSSYRRTANNFGLGNGGRSIGKAGYAGTVDPAEIRQLQYKLARHGLRLMMNLNTYLNYGFFNPTLDTASIEAINAIASQRISDDEADRERYERVFTDFMESAVMGELDIH